MRTPTAIATTTSRPLPNPLRDGSRARRAVRRPPTRSLAGVVLAVTVGGLLATVAPVAARIRRLRTRAAAVPVLDHELHLPGTSPPRTVAVLGDSAAAGHGLADPELALPRRVGRGLWAVDGRETHVRCAAVSGADTAAVTSSQLDDARDAEVVVLLAGVNDALSPRRRLRPAERTYERLLATLTADGSRRVVAVTCPDLSAAPALPRVLRPVVGLRCRSMARRQQRLAGRHGVGVVGLPAMVLPPEVVGDDGLHPGVEGHRRLAEAIVDTLSEQRRATVPAGVG